MSRVRKIAMMGGTFSVALGIGFVMQNGDALAARFATDDELRAAQAQVQAKTETDHFIVLDALPEDQVIEAEQTAAAAAPDASPALPDLAQPIMAASGLSVPTHNAGPQMPSDPIVMAAAEPDDLPQTDAMVDAAAAPGVVCNTALDAAVGAGAMVTLTVDAPCAPGSRGTLHHQGMMFSFVTDETGAAELVVPALAEAAVFIADIHGSDGAMSLVTVPEMAMYDRAVLQWQGGAGLELHAREFGADYGADGHVWQAAARSVDSVVTGDTGFMVSLGDAGLEEALMAEVYTFPSGMTAKEGIVQLSAEIEITDANCGRDISAQSLQMSPTTDTIALDLTLTLPGCDAVGDFLVLQNMFEDLTLASR